MLARRGHEVALVRPPAPPAGGLAESVPPSARKLLSELGVLDAVEHGGFLPNGGNTSWWAGRAPRTERFGQGATGFQVDRERLEAALVGAARATGVTVYDGTSARRVERAEPPDPDERAERATRSERTGPGARGEQTTRSGRAARERRPKRDERAKRDARVNRIERGVRRDAAWTVECARGPTEDGLALRAPWLIDATGRHGLVARRLRRPDRRTSTVAVVRRWRRPGGWPLDEPTHTLLESYRDGWAWSVPLAHDVRCFTAMIDAAAARRARARGASALLAAELAKTVHLRSLLEDAEPMEEAWACPASLYDARSYSEDGLVLAGDAGSFIDPLSSYGVKKALSSGWLAGVAVHTAIVDAGTASVALDFFDAREREVYRRYRLASVPHFEEAAATYGNGYWTERAGAAREAGLRTHTPALGSRQAGAEQLSSGAGGLSIGPAGIPSGVTGRSSGAGGLPTGGPGSEAADPDEVGGPVPAQADVRAAFEIIRTRPALDAALAATARVVERPSVEGDLIVLAPHVASDACPAGLRYVRGVDLPRLVEEAPRHAEVPDVWTAYNAVAPAVALPDFLVALSTAFAAGLLVHRD